MKDFAINNRNLPSDSLNEAKLDLRAPSYAIISKGKWWLRLLILFSVDIALLLISWILVEYRLPWLGQYEYSSMLIAIFIQIASLYFQGNYESRERQHNYGNIIKTLFFAH